MNQNLVLVSCVWSMGPGCASCRSVGPNQDDPIEEDDLDDFPRMPGRSNPHRGMKGDKKVSVSQHLSLPQRLQRAKAVKSKQAVLVHVSRQLTELTVCSAAGISILQFACSPDVIPP